MKIVNWAALNNYNVGPDDMEDQEEFSLNRLAGFISSKFNYGILEGAGVSLNAGLTVSIAEGLIFFSNDRMAKLAAQNVEHDAADAVHDRYDRIEVYYEEDDLRNGVDEGGNALVVTKSVNAKVNIKKGVPAADPAVPALTADSVSIQVVKVRATSVNLLESDLFPDERYRKEATVKKDSPEYEIANAAVTKIPVLVDPNLYKSLIVTYDLLRSAGATAKTHVGELFLIYNPIAATWKVSNPFRGDDCGVAFDIGADKFLEATADDLAGAGYEGKLSIIDIKRVEV